MTKPEPQTKEQIQKDLERERWRTINEFARQMTINLMTELPQPHESIRAAATTLGTIMGNVVNLNETAVVELLKEITAIVDRRMRITANYRANVEAILGSTSNDPTSTGSGATG